MMVIQKSELHFRYNLFKETSYNDGDNSHITAILKCNINIAATLRL